MKSLAALFSILLLMLPFQNCSKPFTTSEDLASLTDNEPPIPGSDQPEPAPQIPNQPPEMNPPVQSNMRMVFMATGHQARTIMSCDDGQTWINDRSDNPATRCWVSGSPNNVECDHTPTSSRGLDAGDGWFYTSYGWGFPGTARRSRDGVTWETIFSNRSSIGIVLSTSGLLTWFSGVGDYPISNDLGLNWSVTRPPDNYFMGRSVARVGNRIWISSDDESRALYSADGGLTIQPVTIPNLSRELKVAEGNGVIVILSSRFVSSVFTSFTIRSTDGGQTWSSQVIYSGSTYASWSDIIFDGTQFVTWAGNQRYTSTNGLNWTATPVNISFGVIDGSVSFNPVTRTFAHISNRWGSYYESQRAFRSTDGINWTQLSGAAFPGGHPIHKIIAAPMEERFCP